PNIARCAPCSQGPGLAEVSVSGGRPKRCIGLPPGCSILLPVARKALFLPPVARSANAPTGTPARQTACLPLEAEGREVGTGSKKRHRKQRADQQTLPVITALRSEE